MAHQINVNADNSTEYVFSKLISFPIKDTFLQKYIVEEENSCTRIIQDMRDNIYVTNTKYELAIVFSYTKRKYFAVTKSYNIIYILSLIEKNYSEYDFSKYNDTNPDVNLDKFIMDNNYEKYLKLKIYTMALNESKDIYNSIYALFMVNPYMAMFSKNTNNEVNEAFNPSLNYILDTLLTDSRYRNVTPFICATVNTVGFPNNVIFCTFHKYILNSILYNLKTKVAVDTSGRFETYITSKCEFLVDMLGYENVNILHYTNIYKVQKLCDTIDENKYYTIVKSYYRHPKEYNIYIIKKSAFMKYINSFRDTLIQSRKYLRSELNHCKTK